MLQQKSIEQYFSEYNISDPDKKVKLLPELTKIIYERNVNVVKFEKEKDEYRKKQFLESAEELDKKIKEIFQDFKGHN